MLSFYLCLQITFYLNRSGSDQLDGKAGYLGCWEMVSVNSEQEKVKSGWGVHSGRPSAPTRHWEAGKLQDMDAEWWKGHLKKEVLKALTHTLVFP